jgi:group I intron endonuclease
METSPKLKWAGIYKVENLINKEYYIGSSANLHKRKIQHMSGLKRGRNLNKPLQKECDIYGVENFVFTIILLCEKEYLTYYEQKCVDILKPKYNICTECVTSTKGVPSSMLNKHHSEETKRKISESLMGHPSNGLEDYHVAEETKQIMSYKRQGFTIRKIGYVGVTKRKESKKWRSRIGINGGRIDLGLFDTPEEAAEAYNKKAIELYGENAKLNIIKNKDYIDREGNIA